jgi:hypothetical protein
MGSTSITLVPLHPTLCLCGGGEEDWIAGAGITKGNVVDINRHMVQGCKDYYFANDLDECF